MSSVSSRYKYILTLASFTVFILVLVLGYVSGKTSSLKQLNDQLTTKTQGIKSQLQRELNRFATVVDAYSHNPQLMTFLNDGNNHQNIINSQLLEIAMAAQALDVYLLTPKGLVVAASNYGSKDSFVGRNFSFRTYVKQALANETGFELAVGVVSAKRGVYFSRAVRNHQSQVVGVLVLKADVAQMELSEVLFPLEQHFSFMIQDQHDLVFLSDQSQWRLRQLIVKSKAKSNVKTTVNSTVDQGLNNDELKLSAVISGTWRHLGFDIWQLSNQQMLVHQDSFSHYPWQIKVFAHDKQSSKQGILVALVLGIAFIAVLSLWLFYRERRKNIIRLKRSHQSLAKQVALRTTDLTQANSQLVAEIEQRENAQTDLKATQQQLIQSAKLATIGELSSSINHELNQPIAALSSYLQTTQKMMFKQRYGLVDENLARMSQVIERLIAIVSQFKNFSRKTSQDISHVELGSIINNALVMVAHHVKHHGVTLQYSQPESAINILAEPIQLEQVLVNLLTNAVDALSDTNNPMIKIDIVRGCGIDIIIKDNGPGIEPHYLNKVFEPFFTTKSLNGLGLGLSISRRIIQSFDGQLCVENDPEGGAIFKIILPNEEPHV